MTGERSLLLISESNKLCFRGVLIGAIGIGRLPLPISILITFKGSTRGTKGG